MEHRPYEVEKLLQSVFTVSRRKEGHGATASRRACRGPQRPEARCVSENAVKGNRNYQWATRGSLGDKLKGTDIVGAFEN